MNWYKDEIAKYSKQVEALKEACTDEVHELIMELIEQENFDTDKIIL